MAAYLGLVPRQHSSGGKARLGHISKRGPLRADADNPWSAGSAECVSE